MDPLAYWWSLTSAYFTTPLTLFGTGFQPYALLPIIGLICLVIGIILAVREREVKAAWLVLPGIAALASPVAIQVAFDILGWVGLGFSIVFGFLGVALWIQLLATDAKKRRPVWLIGTFILSFLAYCGFVAVVTIWGI